MKKVYFFEGRSHKEKGLEFKKYDENVIRESGSFIWGDKDYMGEINELNLIDPNIIENTNNIYVSQGFIYSDEDENELEKRKEEIERNIKEICENYLSKEKLRND